MIKRLKIIFILIIVFLFTFSGGQTVFAGGGTFELTAQNRGVTGSKGVILNIFIGSVDKTIGTSGIQFRLKFRNPRTGQTCTMTQAVSDINGFAQGICYSLHPGVFQVYAEVYLPASNKWMNASDDYFETVYFDRNNIRQLMPLNRLLPLKPLIP